MTGQETLSDSAFGEARLAAIYIVTRGGFTPYLPAVRGTVWPADNRSFAAQPWGKSPFALAAPMYLVSRIGEGSFAFRPDGSYPRSEARRGEGLIVRCYLLREALSIWTREGSRRCT